MKLTVRKNKNTKDLTFDQLIDLLQEGEEIKGSMLEYPLIVNFTSTSKVCGVFHTNKHFEVI